MVTRRCYRAGRPRRRILGAVWTPLRRRGGRRSPLLLGLWAGWRALRDRPVILRQLICGGVVEGLLLVQVRGRPVALAATGGGPADALTFWGYLVTSLLVLPVAAAWAFAERTPVELGGARSSPH